jgi:hypothetical protein
MRTLEKKEGTILNFDERNEVGRIICRDAERITRYFFFASRISEGTDRPMAGQPCTFYIDPNKPTPEGRLPRVVSMIVHDFTADEILRQKESDAVQEVR